VTDDERIPDGEDPAARSAERERARAVLAVAVSERAPARLRARVEALRRPARHRRPLMVAGGAAALAVALLLALLALPGGGPGPSVAQAAALGTRPPTAPAPAVRAEAPALLDAAVDGVAFPAWEAALGWAAVGRRDDRLDGRDAVTVRYARDGRLVAYTIVSGEALRPPAAAPVLVRGGVAFRVVATGGGPALSWERRGRTCVLSGPGVPREALLELAGWRGAGAVGF
jgi:hypothetical protein